MDDKTRQQKIALWKKQAEKLEGELAATLLRKGEAAQQGDLRENAAYQMAIEQAEVISARINDIQKIIAEFEKGGKSNG